MKGIGIDIVDIKRIRTARWMGRIAEYVLSGRELAEMAGRQDKAQFLASRFAVKEAVIKAFPRPVVFHDFEVRKQNAKPIAYFFDSRNQDYTTLVSISHTKTHAIGMAIVN